MKSLYTLEEIADLAREDCGAPEYADVSLTRHPVTRQLLVKVEWEELEDE